MLVLPLCVRVTQLRSAVLVEPRDQQTVDPGVTDDAGPHERRNLVDAVAPEQALAAGHLGTQRVKSWTKGVVAQPVFDRGLHLQRCLGHALVAVGQHRLALAGCY